MNVVFLAFYLSYRNLSDYTGYPKNRVANLDLSLISEIKDRLSENV